MIMGEQKLTNLLKLDMKFGNKPLLKDGKKILNRKQKMNIRNCQYINYLVNKKNPSPRYCKETTSDLKHYVHVHNCAFNMKVKICNANKMYVHITYCMNK